MSREQIIPMSSLGLQGRHEYSIVNPSDAIRRSTESINARNELSIVFSEERGDMPILTVENDSQTDNIYVVANSSAQFMNSMQYPYRDKAKKFKELAVQNAVSVGPTMLAYSQKGDIFVYMADQEMESVKALHRTAESFQRIGIELSQVFWAVSSIDEWIDKYAGKVNILPNVLDPDVLTKYAPKGREKEIKNIALANVATYTKNGVQQLWANQGIPTPETAYYDLGFTKNQHVEENISEIFQKYEKVVMNRVDGCGGYATFFVPKVKIAQTLENQDFLHQRIQVQGMLPVINSPGYTANIYSDGRVQPLCVSRQIFGEPGEHAGNYWKRNYDFRQIAQDFEETNLQAIQVLASAGVVGQVSVDSMIVSEEDAHNYGVPTTTVREANIRPGGSSVINRLKQGKINDKSIDAILTSTKIDLPKKQFFQKNINDYLNSFSTQNTQVILYNYNIEMQRASVAFVGTEAVSETDLLALKKQTISLFIQ